MRIISNKALRDFWRQPRYADSEQPLKSWFREAARADWSKPADIKKMYRNVSVISGNRIVFNIAGNKYRLIVSINYPYRVVYIRFIGTHAEYDKIDAEKI